MKIPVLIEPVNGNGYRVRGLGSDEVVAEGRTDTEALQNFRQAIEGRIHAGAKLTYIDVGSEESGVVSSAGVLEPSDPLVQEWKQIMAENRCRDDESPDPL